MERTGVDVFEERPFGAGFDCAEAGGSLASTDSAGLGSVVSPFVSSGVRSLDGLFEYSLSVRCISVWDGMGSSFEVSLGVDFDSDLSGRVRIVLDKPRGDILLLFTRFEVEEGGRCRPFVLPEF